MISIWDIENKIKLKSLNIGNLECFSIKFCQESNNLFIITSNNKIGNFDIVLSQKIDFKDFKFYPNCVYFLKNSNYCAIGTVDSKIIIFDYITNKDFKEIPILYNEIGDKKINSIAIALFKEKKHLLFCIEKIIFYISDVIESQNASLLKGHKAKVNNVQFGKSEEIIISSGEDKLIIVWIIKNREWEKHKLIYIQKDDIPEKMEIFPNGRTLISSSKNSSKLILWNLDIGFKKKTIFLGNDSKGNSFCLNNNFTDFAYVNNENKIIFKKIVSFENYLEMKYTLDILKNLSVDEIKKKINKEILSKWMRDSIFPLDFSLLHVFVYTKNFESLKKLFKLCQFFKVHLNLFKDFSNKTALDIAISNKNRSLMNLIVSALINCPPPLQIMPSNFSKNIMNLLEMGIPNLGKLIDSRLLECPGQKPDFGAFKNNYCEKTTVNSLDISEKQLDIPLGIGKNELNSKCCEIEIMVLDIPNILCLDTNFVSMLIKMKSNSQIFASKGVQEILNYKWKVFGKSIFTIKAFVHFIYIIIFTINSLFVFENRLERIQELNYTMISKFLDIFLLIYGLNFIFFGLHKLSIRFSMKKKIRIFDEIFNFLFNFENLSLFMCNITIILDLLHTLGKINFYDVNELKVMHSMAIFISWLHLLEFSKGFEETAFMTRTIIQGLFNLRYFLIIVSLVLLSLSFTGIINNFLLYFFVFFSSILNSSKINFFFFNKNIHNCFLLLINKFYNF